MSRSTSSPFGWCALLATLLAAPGAASPGTPTPAADSGWVRLPLPEYDALVAAAAAEPAEDADRPDGASFASAELVLGDRDGRSRLTTTLLVTSAAIRTETLPLPDLGTIFSAEIIGVGVEIIAGDAGRPALRVRPGTTARVRLGSVPTRSEGAGSVSISFEVPESPAVRLLAKLPRGHEDVTLTGGSASIGTTAEAVELEGVLDGGSRATLTFRASATATAARQELVASFAESRLLRLGEDSVRVAARLRVEVLRGTLTELRLTAPLDLVPRVAVASGNSVSSFERDPDSPKDVVLRLGSPVEPGTLDLFLLLEREGAVPDGEWIVPELAYAALVRGESVVAVTTDRPILLDPATPPTGYERIDENDVPKELRSLVDAPVLYAARRVGRETPRLMLRQISYPDAIGPAGVVDSARGLTIALRDGRRVDRWELELQSRESLFRFPLDQDAEVWSVLLDGEPVRPFVEDGRLLVQLGRGERSRGSRKLEVVIARAGALSLPKSGRIAIAAPELPFATTSMTWELLLPENARYRFAGGSVSPVGAGLVGEPEARGTVGDTISSLGSLASGNGGGPGGAAVSGRVLDDTGLPLPGATVAISGPSLLGVRAVTTDVDGTWRFVGIPGGRYQVSASLSGFARTARTIDVPAGSRLSTDLPLRLAATEQVVVTGEAPLLDMSSAAGGTNVTREMFERLPLSRNFTAVVSLDGSEVRPAPRPPALSSAEQNALQRTRVSGVATIPIELPTTGKRFSFAALLVVDGAASVELDVRPAKRGWLF